MRRELCKDRNTSKPSTFGEGAIIPPSWGNCALRGFPDGKPMKIVQLLSLLHFITGGCAPPAPVPGYPLALLPSGSMAPTIPENGGADHAMPAL